MGFDMSNIIMKRRSIRIFKDERLAKEEIRELVKAGLLAPTSRNNRGVELIVVDERDIILKLKDCRNMGYKRTGNRHMAIVVIADREKSDVWVEDGAIAASYIQLRAEDLGLGSVWIQMRNRVSDNDSSENEVRRLLNISEKYGVLCIIALGYKKENKAAYTENDLEESRVHFNKY